ncbi:hypothetical protein SELMODRAFT_403669 [Selaginella moellendorffii]|uniref:Uncharacterized protein n=1 Tax=Selaginella moellendorffii TaxID=88036 RepID=D8QS55_SELML|nr:hypothetical protein SELMODRAFT_403669 [Selaginella moellendorffii]
MDEHCLSLEPEEELLVVGPKGTRKSCLLRAMAAALYRGGPEKSVIVSGQGLHGDSSDQEGRRTQIRGDGWTVKPVAELEPQEVSILLEDEADWNKVLLRFINGTMSSIQKSVQEVVDRVEKDITCNFHLPVEMIKQDPRLHLIGVQFTENVDKHKHSEEQFMAFNALKEWVLDVVALVQPQAQAATAAAAVILGLCVCVLYIELLQHLGGELLPGGTLNHTFHVISFDYILKTMTQRHEEVRKSDQVEVVRLKRFRPELKKKKKQKRKKDVKTLSLYIRLSCSGILYINLIIPISPSSV